MKEKVPTQAEIDAAAHAPGNEGEGSRTGADAYDKANREFVKSSKVEKAARDAERAVSGDEAAELERAEAEGKSHSHGEDPALRQK